MQSRAPKKLIKEILNVVQENNEILSREKENAFANFNPFNPTVTSLLENKHICDTCTDENEALEFSKRRNAGKFNPTKENHLFFAKFSDINFEQVTGVDGWYQGDKLVETYFCDNVPLDGVSEGGNCSRYPGNNFECLPGPFDINARGHLQYHNITCKASDAAIESCLSNFQAGSEAAVEITLKNLYIIPVDVLLSFQNSQTIRKTINGKGTEIVLIQGQLLTQVTADLGDYSCLNNNVENGGYFTIKEDGPGKCQIAALTFLSEFKNSKIPEKESWKTIFISV